MMKELLQEIQELKALVQQLISLHPITPTGPGSTELLNSAASRYHQMKGEQQEWIDEDDLEKYFKDAWHRAGAFIRREFAFVNCIKDGRHYRFLKKDIIALRTELKERNVDLARYMEYTDSKAQFDRKIEGLTELQLMEPYKIPVGLEGIVTSEIPKPPAEVIRADLENLKKQFLDSRYGDYIDIYKDNYAILKHMYWYQKYLEPKLKKTCKKWADDFNYANKALELVTGKKEKFIPIKEEDMIEL